MLILVLLVVLVVLFLMSGAIIWLFAILAGVSLTWVVLFWLAHVLHSVPYH